MAEIREIGKPHRRDELIARLRRLADNMEQGEVPEPRDLIVLWSHEDGVSESSDGDRVSLLGMLSAAQMQIAMEQADG